MIRGCFRYVFDPLFVVAVSAYSVNRWFIRPALPPTEVFLRGYFNDLLLIPAALPPLLMLHRKFGFRSHDNPPSVREIALHVMIWSVFIEIIGPSLYGVGTADAWDAVAYAGGGLMAWGAWLFLYKNGVTVYR